MEEKKKKKEFRYKISSTSDLWNPFEITTNEKGIVIERTLGCPVEIGADINELRKYWNIFTGDMGYKVEEIKDE